MAVSGKRIAKIYESFDRFTDHNVSDAVKIVQEAKKTNFGGKSIETARDRRIFRQLGAIENGRT